jgi:hypothetical protein
MTANYLINNIVTNGIAAGEVREDCTCLKQIMHQMLVVETLRTTTDQSSRESIPSMLRCRLVSEYIYNQMKRSPQNTVSNKQTLDCTY